MRIESMDTAIGTESRAASSIVRGWFRYTWGSALEFFHAPAKIREFEYIDPSTNETVYLATGARYSVLHVGDKRFFFERTTGKFDGTCTSLQERVADGLELCD
jgi:hypothetical protein